MGNLVIWITGLSRRNGHVSADDFLHVNVVAVSHLQQNLAVTCCDGAYEAHGIVLIVVLAHVAVEESLDLVGNKVAGILVVEMVGKEERVVVLS